MDDRRFDSLTKALARGQSRRSLLKGLLGLGGAAAVGGTLLEGPAEAARRPTPTPKPITCPGNQIPVGGVCTCPGGLSQCNPGTGPACCNSGADPTSPGYSECCDNACCNGTCYGEELCCRTTSRTGGLPPTHKFCDDVCIDLTVAGNCCDDGDCGNPCQVCNHDRHICVDRCDAQTQVCCTEQAGPGVCVTGECCLGVPGCGAGRICCQGEGRTICVAGDCCAASDCPHIDACTTNTCHDHHCTQAPVDCDDGNVCTIDTCDPVAGCIHQEVSCDDHNACTVDSCDPAIGCVNLAVDCNDDNSCTIDSCNPALGCVHTPIDCNDGNACTIDSCDTVLGCIHTPVDCNDNNLCTIDACDPTRGCVYTVIDCNDGNACTEDWCDPPTGCKHTPINCDDGNPCTTNECDPAVGCVHNPISCDDGDPCTIGTCYPNTGCIYTPVDCSGVGNPANCLVGVCSNGTCFQEYTCGNRCCVGGTCAACGGGCFVGETRIAMADGASKPVANIVAGDLVLGDNGQINTVIGIDRLALDNRLLYGLNGSMPFVTASHPFMTDDGWRAIDPANSYLDHRLPAVGQLAIGDRLVLLAGVLAPIGASPSATCPDVSGIRTDAIALASIEGVALPAATLLYNLRLDGNHTYFANELLVHNKLIFEPVSSEDGTVPDAGGI